MSETTHTSQQALAALNRAALDIAGELSVDKVLQEITDAARSLVQSRYAALGVPGGDGFLSKFLTSGMSTDVEKRIPHRPKGLGLLGALLHEGRSIRLPDIGADPRSIGFPVNHPPMFSFLGVPIRAGQEVLGNLYLTDKIDEAGQPTEFTAADQELVEMLATHAAVAIQNARLYEQVGRLAVIEERSRIGMDLHDGIIQSIYAVGLTLESARLYLPDEPQESDKLLQAAIGSLNEVIRDIRNFILDLRPRHFAGNLNQTLTRLVREFQANAMIPVTLEAEPALLDELSTSLARTVFLTTQEALANVARHARATEVMVEIKKERDFLILCVRDDGHGFDLAAQAQSVGHGLANMRARAEEREGLFEIKSEPDEGTTIRLSLPLHQ